MGFNTMFFGSLYPERMEYFASLNCPGFLSNANGMLKTFGENMTIEEMTAECLRHNCGKICFISIHGKDCDSIVDLALRCNRQDPEHVGVKILANEVGFQAINKLSKMGVKCIVTGLYTVGQAIMAAQVGAFAISPFVHRGNEYGLPMEERIKTMRKVYDRMDNPPLILTASIRDWDDLELAIRCGSDAFAASGLIEEAMYSDASKETELSFGKAFAKMKGEDLSYLGLDKNGDANFVE